MKTEKLINMIPIGKESAIHLNDLARKLGVSCETVKDAVRSARHEGAAIISGIEGYWISEDAEEYKKCTAMISKQAFTRLNTVRKMNSARDRENSSDDASEGVNGNGE